MSYIQISIFLIVSLSIVFSIHYFIYFSVVRFFSVSNYLLKCVLLTLAFALPLCFILSMFLVRVREDFLSRAFYFLSGFWMGFVVYLLAAVLAAWLFVWAGKFFGFSINTAVLAASFFVVAVLVSFYGVYNAFNPVIKNISVNISGLPESWKGEKVVQISDAHVGNILSAGFIKNVVEKINSVHPKAVFITGDFFDSADGNLNSLAKMLDGIKTGKGVFLIMGNHETYLGVDKVVESLEKTKVKVLRDEIVDVDGLKIIGADYPERESSKDVARWLESVKNLFYGKPNILLFHSPANAEEISKEGIDLQLSGHTHAGQIFPFGYITRMIYGKYYYGLHKIGDYTIYTSSGVGVWGPTMRTEERSEIVVITLE